jgi:hypothetical protein
MTGETFENPVESKGPTGTRQLTFCVCQDILRSVREEIIGTIRGNVTEGDNVEACFMYGNIVALERTM